MANKRQLKKNIRYACGDIAGECIFAQQVFGQDKLQEWDDIIIKTALLQQEAINRITVDFDTENDGTVTVRDRDTMTQERIKIEDLRGYIEKLMEF